MTAKPNNGNSVRRIVRILALVTRKPWGVSAREVGEAVGITQNAAYKILAIMESEGVLESYSDRPDKYRGGAMKVYKPDMMWTEQFVLANRQHIEALMALRKAQQEGSTYGRGVSS